MVGTSIALSISDIPWNGPISGVSVGLVDGEYVINPTAEQREESAAWPSPLPPPISASP